VSYEAFIETVMAGRGLSEEEVRALAEGQVWTGKQALENGLVDELGGLDAAIAKAKELASLEEIVTEDFLVGPQPGIFAQLAVGTLASGNIPEAALTIWEELDQFLELGFDQPLYLNPDL
jgi:protease-4